MTMSRELEELARDAKQGDRAALDALVGRVQDRIYGLAMRMMANPVDAEDATQEILIKVITNLGTFRGESAITTWIHRIAVNHLLTWRSRTKPIPMSLEQLAGLIRSGLAERVETDGPADRVLTEEVRITCTQAMLTAMDRDHRMAFILGKIFELSGEEGAAILEITPAAFRKRVSRATAVIEEFMKDRCGAYDAANPCRCSIQVPYAVRHGMLDPNRLRFAHDQRDEVLEEVLGVLDVGALYRSHPEYRAPAGLVTAVRDLLQPKKS
jgi:RNA polymerase sigma factor (sigma-70 family)